MFIIYHAQTFILCLLFRVLNMGFLLYDIVSHNRRTALRFRFSYEYNHFLNNVRNHSDKNLNKQEILRVT